MSIRRVSLAILLSPLAGCGSDAEEATQTESGGGEDAPSDTPAPTKAWADRTFDERKDFMAKVVMPTMKDVFQRFDAEEFASFDCRTCHGQNAMEVQFHMPNGLHPLNPQAMPTPDSPDANVARWARFMMDEVKPKMTELLGAQPYDPATNQGFGCFNCHAMEQ